ncbi:MAG TPA: sulfur carrier protein ThiS [Nitrospirota bacterium]|nr:sulfur carrier protein ThiS [Nitrospirota bacterium]
MKLHVNGSDMVVADGTDLNTLLCSLGLCETRVAVELNRAILPKETFQATILKEGDVLEILSFVGGG